MPSIASLLEGIIIYGSFGLPFVTVGLTIFGIPAASIFKGCADKWWVTVIAILSGAFFGRLMYLAVCLYFGASFALNSPELDLGTIFGVSSAVAWLVIYRRLILKPEFSQSTGETVVR